MSEKKRTIMAGTQKAKVALEAAKGNKTVNEIAQEYGVHPTQVGLWKKALLENAGQLFDVKRGSKTIRETMPQCRNCYWVWPSILPSTTVSGLTRH